MGKRIEVTQESQDEIKRWHDLVRTYGATKALKIRNEIKKNKEHNIKVLGWDREETR